MVQLFPKFLHSLFLFTKRGMIIVKLMGKKKITNKFASVKRIISTQDHRLYD
jgi:hypothetical protein